MPRPFQRGWRKQTATGSASGSSGSSQGTAEDFRRGARDVAHTADALTELARVFTTIAAALDTEDLPTIDAALQQLPAAYMHAGGEMLQLEQRIRPLVGAIGVALAATQPPQK